MKRLALSILFAGLLCPVTAAAGTHATSFKASQEKGVTVYRGQASAYNYHVMAAVQDRKHLREEQAKIKSRLAMQERALAAQQRDIANLQIHQSHHTTSEPKRRSRYGRSYIGNNRFFGRNGFIGNSNFSGASQALPRSRRRSHRPRNHRKHH